MRTSEPTNVAHGLDDTSLSDRERLAPLIAQPVLIARPILVAGDKAVIARSPERVLELVVP